MLLPALSGHQLVVLWTELASLLLLARLLGALARRFRQPAVVGELVAGLVLGPSVLGQVSPTARQWFLPAGPGQGDLLTTVSQLSLLVLLVVVGAEADLPLIRSLGPAAASVSATTLLLPLGAGVAAATLLPPGFRAGGQHVAFVLLVAGAVGVSSLPVVGKIMADLGLLRRNFAQLSLAAGTANDMVGFLLVTAATGLSGAGTPARLALALGGLMAAVVAVFTVGQWGVDAVLRRVRARGPNVAGSLTVAMVAAFAAAAACQAVGLEGALGGFLAGVALGRSRFQQGEAMSQLTRFTDAVLAPLFFATAGLRVDLTTLGRPSVLVATVLLVIGAVVAKGVSGIVGARLAGLAWRDGVALGVVLNGRGTLQVIIAGAALTAGVFTSAAYSAVIVLAIVSSLSVAPMLSLVLRGWRGTEQEQDRLEEEQRLAANVMVRDERLLVATGGSPSSYVAAAVLHHAWPERQPVTILAVGERSDAVDGPGRGATWMFPGRPVEMTTVGGEAVLRDVLAETRLGYGVLALGAADVPGPERLLSSVVDDIVIRCPIPMLVARRGRLPSADDPARWQRSQRARSVLTDRAVERAAGEEVAFHRILVPLSGSATAHAAQEVAFGLAASRRSDVTLLHVVTRRRSGREAIGGRSADRPGRDLLRDAEQFAARHGVRVQTRSRRAPAAGDEIVRLAAEIRADCIVLGASARALDGRPFLGHTVEHVLAAAQAAVVVAVLPAGEPAGDVTTAVGSGVDGLSPGIRPGAPTPEGSI